MIIKNFIGYSEVLFVYFFLGFYQIYDSHFNSAKLSCIVDRTWSTACTWCSFLCNLLVNSWAGEIFSFWTFQWKQYDFLSCVAPAHMSNLVPLSLAALCRSEGEFLDWWVMKPVHPASLEQTFLLVLLQESLQLLLHVR